MPDANPLYEKVPRPESIDALVRYLQSLKVVIAVERIDAQLVRVERDGRPPITAFLTNIYIIGEADATEIISEHRGVDCIVTMSAWNGYTNAAKTLCQQEHIGLFTFKEFLGAVYKTGQKFLAHRTVKNHK